MDSRGICVGLVVDLWKVKTTPRGAFFKWMAELKVASRKLHAFAGWRDTDMLDCGSLQQIIEYLLNIYGISRNLIYIYIYIYGITMDCLWIIFALPMNHPWGCQKDSKNCLPQMSGQVSKLLQTSFTHLRFGTEYHGISLNVMEYH
jgi:hypothetical protein